LNSSTSHESRQHPQVTILLEELDAARKEAVRLQQSLGASRAEEGALRLALEQAMKEKDALSHSQTHADAEETKLSAARLVEAEKTIQVSVGSPNSKVLYWAADPGTEIRATWQEGYGKFENSGVVVSDARGMAQIPLVCPSRYIVHGYKILPKHVHYRVFNAQTQMLSRIFTVVLTNECAANQ
jgi:hypothetical protein